MANESFAMTCLSAPFMHKSLNQSSPCPAEIAGEVVAPAVDAVAEARPDDVDRLPPPDDGPPLRAEEAYFNTLKKWGTVHFAPKIDDLCWLTGDNVSLLLLVANCSLNCIYVLLDLKRDLLLPTSISEICHLNIKC